MLSCLLLAQIRHSLIAWQIPTRMLTNMWQIMLKYFKILKFRFVTSIADLYLHLKISWPFIF